MKTASYPGWALEMVEAERVRCGVAPTVTLKMARNACSVCGSIVVMHESKTGGAVACISCGASGKQRTKLFAGNDEAFITVAGKSTSEVA